MVEASYMAAPLQTEVMPDGRLGHGGIYLMDPACEAHRIGRECADDDDESDNDDDDDDDDHYDDDHECCGEKRVSGVRTWRS